MRWTNKRIVLRQAEIFSPLHNVIAASLYPIVDPLELLQGFKQRTIALIDRLTVAV